MQNVIYKITNMINGKCYVGKTKNLTNRWKQHLKNSRNINYRHPLYDSIRHHGIDNFKLEIIDECQTYEELDELEIQYIKQYNSIENGYNISIGGNGGFSISNHPNKDKILDSMSKASKRNWKNLDYRKRVSSGVKNAWNTPSIKANILEKRNTPSNKKKISDSSKERWKNQEFKDKYCKKVIRILDGKIYNSFRDAAEDNNRSISNIGHHVAGRIKRKEFKYCDI